MILTKVNVDDFDQFWSVFSSRGAAHRRKFGSKGSKVIRDEDDPHRVLVLFDWAKEDFERFLQDPEAKEIMSSAGLEGPPELLFSGPPAGEIGS